jgi:hypothetical protein
MVKKWLVLEPYVGYLVTCKKVPIQIIKNNSQLPIGGKIIAKI